MLNKFLVACAWLVQMTNVITKDFHCIYLCRLLGQHSHSECGAAKLVPPSDMGEKKARVLRVKNSAGDRFR